MVIKFTLIFVVAVFLYYHRIDTSKGTYVAKSNKSKGCIISTYWYLNHG